GYTSHKPLENQNNIASYDSLGLQCQGPNSLRQQLPYSHGPY
ncbi:895_t:CDS:1, partial [Cetraspora pellucida]